MTDPFTPLFQQYLRTDADISPEGLEFISAADSPNGEPLLAVSNEGSGTLRLYSLISTVATAELADGTLRVQGTSGNDHIRVNRHGRWIKVTWNGDEIGRFDKRDVTQIVADGKSGDDRIDVDGSVQADTLLKGGLGDDILKGAWLARNVLVGGPGNDWLYGGLKDDVLIGGRGNDVVLAGFLGLGSDLLIGGETAYDLDNVALQNVLSRWSGPGSYHQRVTAIRVGSGAPALNASTVFDDGARDLLFGGLGRDWFFDGQDDILDDRFFEESDPSGDSLA